MATVDRLARLSPGGPPPLFLERPAAPGKLERPTRDCAKSPAQARGITIAAAGASH